MATIRIGYVPGMIPVTWMSCLDSRRAAKLLLLGYSSKVILTNILF